MCLIVFAWNHHRRYRLILAANRDEFYDRPTAKAHFWPDSPDVLAGRDLKEGGTWMGISRTDRFSAITNYRNPSGVKNNARSRGFLVSDFLKSDIPAGKYLGDLQAQKGLYNDFNLLFGDHDDLYYVSSQASEPTILSPGIYGLSNHLLNTSWPKVKSARDSLTGTISGDRNFSMEELFRSLSDRVVPDDDQLPQTGVGIEWERILGPVFITSTVYGTRSSTVLLIDHDNMATLVERTFDMTDPENFEQETFHTCLK